MQAIDTSTLAGGVRARAAALWPNKGEAERVNVDVGKASVNDIVVRRGLTRGDSIIISDMSQELMETRVRLK